LESGWTDTYNCEHWIDEVFIPFVKKHCVDDTKPIVLIMGGHNTHETLELQHVVYKQLDEEDLEIIIVCFPSKYTHKCQPLDVVVFLGVEHKWQGVCDRHLQAGIPINCITVIPAYIHGTQGAMIKELIAKAFKKTSLYLVNHTVFQPQDFSLSKALSSISYCIYLIPFHIFHLQIQLSLQMTTSYLAVMMKISVPS
jgi:hypothetical protein